MYSHPFISVIVPFHNAFPYIGEAIESVLLQTYPHWELLLIDDGSSDGSTEVALQYVQKFPGKIKYFQHPGGLNKGTAATRNVGCTRATGDYLALLDADDYWLPGKLAFQVSVVEKFPQASMICGASLYWNSWEDENKKDIVVPVGGPQDTIIAPPMAALVLYPLGGGAAPCPCSIMVKKEVVLKYHFEEKFNGKYAFYEDQAFLIKIYLHEQIYISSRAVDRYRQHKGSVMSQSERQNNYDEVRYFFLQWLENYLRQNTIFVPVVQKRLREAFFPYKFPLLYKMKKKLLTKK